MTKEKILIRLFVNGHISADELKTLCMDEVFVPHFTVDVPSAAPPPEHIYDPSQVRYRDILDLGWIYNDGSVCEATFSTIKQKP